MTNADGTKRQTPAQRITNPVWLRRQIEQRLREVAALIDDEQCAIDRDPGNREKYLGRIESHRYWKRQLERILRGSTVADDVAEGIAL